MGGERDEDAQLVREKRGEVEDGYEQWRERGVGWMEREERVWEREGEEGGSERELSSALPTRNTN